MLLLKSLTITQFKNYSHQRFLFDQNIVAVTGSNGIGKTNLLDAIYYLCFTKSYFASVDGFNVQQGTEGFRLEGHFQLSTQPVDLTIILRENGKKEMYCNGTPYEKFSQHIGQYPCVMVAPDDVELITGTSDLRRKFLDTLLCQLDPVYLQQLILYNKILQQRNSYLKNCAASQSRNPALLEVLDQQLMAAGSIISQKRKDFLPGFQQQVLEFYTTIAGKNEPLELVYESQLLNTTFGELLSSSREKDYLLQRSTVGIHKDNLDIRLNGEAFKNSASQGQRKSLLFALKIAEAETLKRHKGFAPLLLLDDVFEKLDAKRMHNLLAYICSVLEAQVFITDTHPQRIKKAFLELEVPVQVLSLE